MKCIVFYKGKKIKEVVGPFANYQAAFAFLKHRGNDGQRWKVVPFIEPVSSAR